MKKFALDKIYLNDPYGCFDEECQDRLSETAIIWSEDRIDDEDIEYVRAGDIPNILYRCAETLKRFDIQDVTWFSKHEKLLDAIERILSKI